MDIDIRKSIKNNFKDASIDEISASIESSIQEGDEVTLPGVGVFFELLWSNSSPDEKEFILKKLENTLKA